MTSSGPWIDPARLRRAARAALRVWGVSRLVAGLCATLCLAAHAHAQAPAPPPALALVLERTDEALAPVEAGVLEWLRARLVAAGLPLVTRERVAGALAARSRPDDATEPLVGERLAALAGATGAGRVLVAELVVQEGRAEVRLRLHGGRDGALVAGSQREGPLHELGAQLAAALGGLATAAGLPARLAAPVPPPDLPELGRYARAVERLRAGALADAWRELEPVDTPAAEVLRGEIASAGEAPEVALSERSRLASAQGQPIRHWLRVRQGIARGGDPALLVAGGDAALARGEVEAATSLYEQAAEAAPQLLAAQRGLGRAAQAAGRTQVARSAWQRVLTLAPGDPEPHEALAALAEAPHEQAQHRLRAGEIRARWLEADASQEHFEAAARLDPDVTASARSGVGQLRERLGQPHEALLAYEEAAAVAPEDSDLLAAVGRARARSGDPAGSEAAFRRVLELDPDHPAALRDLGSLMVEQERPADALAPLQRALARDPQDVRTRRALARSLALTGRPAEGLELLDPQAVPAPRRAELLVEAAALHRTEGRLDAARTALERAVALEPGDPRAREALAAVHEARGDASAAEAQRGAVATLAALTPTRDEAPEPASGGGAPPSTDWVRLAESFPLETPLRGAPLGPVVQLGILEEGGAAALLRRWLHPFAPDDEALAEAFRAAFGARFALLDPPPLPEVARGAAERILALSTDREDVALLNDVLECDAVVVGRLVRRRDAGSSWPTAEHYEIEVRLLGGRHPDDVYILANQLTLPAEGHWRAWNLRAAAPAALLLVLLALPFVRGWGSVVVKLDYEGGKGAKGFFSIQLSRKPGRARLEKAKEGRSPEAQYQRRVRAWSRTSRYMVDRVTRFRFLPARTWYVAVHGLLQEAASREVIGNYLEEKRIEVARGEETEVVFDFRPREAALEVQLLRPAGDETAQILVALHGRPDSFRYAKEASTVFHVADGEHVVVAGLADRVYEQRVPVSEHRAARIRMALTGDVGLVFSGCPEAVEPYLAGDFLAASTALERAGQVEVAHLLRARVHEERGETDQAARFYEAAGHLTEAAELSAGSSDAERSATLFEQVGDFGRAAERYAAAGDHRRAAEAWEAAYDYEKAIDAYRSAGDPEKAMELLERTGGYYEAAAAALEHGAVDRAIRNLQQVDLRDPDYPEACRILARVFAEREEWSLALGKAQEAMDAVGDEAAPLELHEHLAQLLERAGRLEEALSCYEAVRKRDFAYPGVAERITALRASLQEAATRAALATAPQRPAGSDLSAAVREDRYELLEEVGRGGMGIVYKARDRRLGRIVALKRLPDNLRDHPTAVQLFLREARAAAALNHPNIVTLFDADQFEGNYYLTMEFLEGLPLDQVLRKRSRLGVRDTLRLAVQIATGLQYAHERRIVHRDIKTSNLFFTRDRVVKIMDFGLAKMVEEVRRAATVIGGTPYYMAPEQAAGEAVDHRADLYAFGVTLFELLTGGVPFTEGDVTYHHRHTPPPDPRERVSGLPDAVAELLLQLVAKDPDARPATTTEVTERLAALLRSSG